MSKYAAILSSVGMTPILERLCDIEHDRFAVSIKLAKEFAKKLDLPAEWLVKLALQDQINKEKLSLKVS